MAKTKTRSIFICQECGAQRPRWEGRCSECSAWNSLVEEVTSSGENDRAWAIGQAGRSSDGGLQNSSLVEAIALDQSVVQTKVPRTSTSFSELDRVLGGGLVPGAFLLVGGDPGIGKSTLLLQMAGGLARQGKRTLYVSAEESVQQTALRAQRLGVREKNVEVASESRLEIILKMAEEKKPDAVIVDSIQTVYLPELQSAPGSVSQVRECAAQLMGLAKNRGIAVFLVGHVTKEGQIAGPKVLEHMVDTVLSFEGDITHQFRLLRATKNRFGPTNELGVFQMANEGLEEVSNPSEFLLQERSHELVGSTIFACMEGTRPLLVEVQALTTPTPMAMPRRTAVGFDTNRVHLLIAVLCKHAELQLGQCDVYVNVVGGLKIFEPAADLAIAAALLSSECRREISEKACFFGEIGLTGEVRAVSFADKRLHEAHKLGFEKFYIPHANQKHLANLDAAIHKKIIWVKNVRDLTRAL